MHGLTHAVAISESVATEIIMNACQNNHERNAYYTPGKPSSFSVTFNSMLNNEFEAVVRDSNGFTVAVAVVDQFDN